MVKPSAYNIAVRDPSGRRLALYNSLYGSLTTFDPDEMAEVEGCLAWPSSGRSSSIGRLLRRQKHIVASGADELAPLQARKSCATQDSSVLEAVVIPTLRCNYSCSYCYQETRTGVMSAETSRRLVAWLSSEIAKREAVSLRWFGGEPLLEIGVVLSASTAARDAAAAAGVAFTGHITTNGYLLSPSVTDELINAGVTDYQITLDGPAETHDLRRTLLDGSPTFGRTFANVLHLLSLAPQVSVTTRANLDAETVARVPDMLRQIPDALRKHAYVSFEPVFGVFGMPSRTSAFDYEFGAAVARLYRLAETLGFAVAGILERVGRGAYCSAEHCHQYVVNVNGDLHKCSASDYARSERVGHLTESGGMVLDERRMAAWTGDNGFEAACVRCRYLPLCMGGCRKTRMGGEGTGSFCAFIPGMVDEAIRLRAFGGQPVGETRSESKEADAWRR